nr:ARMT1-like domain-containing protein [Candidatus Freyrarchaeum guaymaensis]
MKIKPICIVCLISRAYKEVERLTGDVDARMKAVKAVVEAINREINHEDHPFHLVPAYLGTVRERVIREVIGVDDPFAEIKAESNRVALNVLSNVSKSLKGKDGFEKFRQACLLAVAGNIIEFDVLGHEFRLEDVTEAVVKAEDELVIDDTEKLYKAVKGGSVLYLTDNAGEIVFDTVLVRELKRVGARVTVAVKGGPVMNDATMADALEAEMHKVADNVVTTGTDCIGLFLHECSSEFLEEYRKADVIVAKGMGNFESMTEVEHPCDVYFLLRTKCTPVAECIGVPKGGNVVLRLPKGEKLKC